MPQPVRTRPDRHLGRALHPASGARLTVGKVRVFGDTFRSAIPSGFATAVVPGDPLASGRTSRGGALARHVMFLANDPSGTEVSVGGAARPPVGCDARDRVVLVPFWRGLPPEEFRAWFAAHAPRIASLMIPLGGATTLIAVGAAMRADGVDERLPVVAAVGVAAVTLAVNEPANRRFMQKDALTDQETQDLLARWIRWHNVRVLLGLFGFVVAIRAARR